MDTYEDVVEDYKEGHYPWGVLEPYLEGKDLNVETVSKAISKYYNAVEKKVQDCIQQINSNFLINVFSNMVDCGNEFWEIEGACIKEKMPKCYTLIIRFTMILWEANDEYEKYRSK